MGVREVPAGRPDPDDADEVGGGGDGNRQDLQEAFMKAFRSLELGRSGRLFAGARRGRARARHRRDEDEDTSRCIAPWRSRRTGACGPCSGARARLVDRGAAPGDAHRSWFLTQFQQIVELAREVGPAADGVPADLLRELKRAGFGDARSRRSPARARTRSARAGRRRGCRSPINASTRARPSSSRSRRTSTGRSRRVRGGGHRSAEGDHPCSGRTASARLEFDYCCCHAAFALRDEGFETV